MKKWIVLAVTLAVVAAPVATAGWLAPSGLESRTAQHLLAVKRSSPGGTVTAPPLINCGARPYCWALYDDGAQVTLEAIPHIGWKFAGWSWDGQSCGEYPTCTITIDSDKVVLATFVHPRG